MRVRSVVQDFKPYSPGMSIAEIRQRYGLDRVIKLASNENPLGVSASVQSVLCRDVDQIHRYPRSGSPDLVQAIAEYHSVGTDSIVAGNGSDEIIDLLLRTVPTPGRDNVVAFKPCFSIYELQSRLCGLEFRQVLLNPDFTFPWEALRKEVNGKTAFVFVTSPDNPSGYAPPAGELRAFAGSLPPDCLLVVDEAYMDFAADQERYSLIQEFQQLGNVVVLRTFSKMFGLAGLRLGYGLMPPPLAEALMRIKLPFSVNAMAESAGIAALSDRDFTRKTLETVHTGRAYLSREMARLGCEVFPSQANFVLTRPPVQARELFRALLSRGIIIRHLGSYGLEDFLRVSIGTDEENRVFVKALEELI